MDGQTLLVGVGVSDRPGAQGGGDSTCQREHAADGDPGDAAGAEAGYERPHRSVLTAKRESLSCAREVALG